MGHHWAKGIENQLVSRSFVLGIHFSFDLLVGLKRFSLISQKSAGILVGKEQFRLDLLAFILDLKDNGGAHLTALLRKATCSETEGSYCTSKEFLESSSIVEYKSIELTKDTSEVLSYKRKVPIKFN